MQFINNLYEILNIDDCNDEEIKYLTKVSALIGYYFQLNDMKIPKWLRGEKLRFKKQMYILIFMVLEGFEKGIKEANYI